MWNHMVYFTKYVQKVVIDKLYVFDATGSYSILGYETCQWVAMVLHSVTSL